MSGDPIMGTRVLLWARRVASVLIFLVVVMVAFAAGLLTPYWLAPRTANILLLTISAIVSFAVVTGAGTKLAVWCWGPGGRRLTAALSGLLTVLFVGFLYFGVLRSSASHFSKVVSYPN